jgi:integrase
MRANLTLDAAGNGKARRYPKATTEALRSRRIHARSIKTSNLYLDSTKQFAAWLVQDRRMPDNPLAHLSGGNVKLDRRSLSLEELRSAIQEANLSDRGFRELTGPDLAILYSVACASGFRASELARLCPSAFDLDGDPPTITLSAAEAKNGKTAVQPLPPDIASALRGYLAGRPVQEPVWPGTWAKKAAEMFNLDLDAAGIPYVVDGPDGPLYADFHALRHSFIAMLDRSGATLKEAMQLARHSDPKLTMSVYGRTQLHDLGEAVRRLPDLLHGPASPAAAFAATGTDDQPGRELPPSEVSSLRSACASADVSCGSLSVIDNPFTTAGDDDGNEQALENQGVECGRELVIASEGSSPTRTRTWNKPVNRSVKVTAFSASKPLQDYILRYLSLICRRVPRLSAACKKSRKFRGPRRRARNCAEELRKSS